MHKLLLFLKRKPGMSTEAFRAYYEERHAPVCMKYMAGVDRYARRYIEHAPGMPEMEFDVITEVWFKDRTTLDLVIETASKDAMPADVIADEENLFDRSKSRFCAVTEYETQIG